MSRIEQDKQNPIVGEICSIIEQGKRQAYAEVSKAVIMTYWSIGRRLVEEEQHGKERAAYGTELIKNVAKILVPLYGNSYNKRNLDYYKRFYMLFPNMQIVNTRVHNLNWSHIRRLLSVADPQARLWCMKRFVIFELKTHKLTHQDIGQLDMYVRMYDDLIKQSDDAPTIGVLLCTDTDNTIARYSVLHDSNNLYAAKYMTYMPTEEELRNEIEQQKRFFLEQHSKETEP